GPSTLIKDHLAGGASRLAALPFPQILPVFSVVAPCHPGAALRDLVLVQCGRATSASTGLPQRRSTRPRASTPVGPRCRSEPHANSNRERRDRQWRLAPESRNRRGQAHARELLSTRRLRR